MSRIFRNPEVMWRVEDDAVSEALELMAKGGEVEEVGTSLLFSDGVMVSLNILGTEIWKKCDGRSKEDLLADILAEFDVERDILQQDLDSFLEDLASKGFIHYE
jgi:GeoRSP system PqqD family protein